MPRPRKWRRVCFLPESTVYGPLQGSSAEAEVITMTVDEYETIRLIDLEEMTQEECAQQMNVARTTVQRIYISARRKLAKSLVNGQVLTITGGDYKICTIDEIKRGCGHCRRGRCSKRIETNSNIMED